MRPGNGTEPLARWLHEPIVERGGKYHIGAMEVFNPEKGEWGRVCFDGFFYQGNYYYTYLKRVQLGCNMLGYKG